MPFQPVAFQGCRTLLCGISADFGIQCRHVPVYLGGFLFGQEAYAFQLPVLVFVVRTFLFGDGVDAGAYLRVDAGSGQLLQNVRLFALLALQELGEVALRQQGGAAELLEGKSDGSLYLRLYLILPGKRDARLPVFQCPLGVLDGTGQFAVGACHVPPGGVGHLVRADKLQLCPCLIGVPPHQLAAVVDGNLLLLGGKALSHVPVPLVLRAVHAGRLVVERQADGVEQCRFPGSRLAADEE